MSITTIRQKIKPWMLPIAMMLGVVFHNDIHHVAFLSKYLIFTMLLITYCRVKINDFHIGGYIWWLLAMQILGALTAYMIIRPFNEIIAQGTFLCFFCPTATAAPVVTGMLGGSVPRVATFSLLSHVSVAVLGPVFLSWMSPESSITFFDSVVKIGMTVVPLIIGPLAIALLLQKVTPKTHHAIATHQGLSFYIWSVALLIVVGNAASLVLNEPAEMIPDVIILSAVSLFACFLQFKYGRKVGEKYGDKISGAQSIGQKNTILAIWLSLTYLDPLVSIAPATYVAWHNSYNSLQIFMHQRKAAKLKAKSGQHA